MKKTKFTPSSTVILQLVAHNEVNAVIVDGKCYVEMPTPEIGGGAVVNEEVTPARKSAPAEKEPAAPAERPAKIYTQKELDKIAAKEDGQKLLRAILEDEFGLDADEVVEGRKTTGKLSAAILEHQESLSNSGKKAAANDDEIDEKPARGRGGDNNVTATAAKLLAEIEEGGKVTPAVDAFMEAFPKADETVVRKLFKEFHDNADLKAAEHAKKFSAAVGGAPEEAEPAPARGRGAKPKTVTIEHIAENCEPGQRISAYWPDYEETYEGEITSIKRGKVSVHWDDDTDAVLNDEEHTDITLL